MLKKYGPFDNFRAISEKKNINLSLKNIYFHMFVFF